MFIHLVIHSKYIDISYRTNTVKEIKEILMRSVGTLINLLVIHKLTGNCKKSLNYFHISLVSLEPV